MKQSNRLAILALAFGLLVLPSSAHALDITVTGSWSLTIDATDLVSGAGSDLIDTYESASDQVYVSILNTPEANRWRVDVKRTDTTWHGDLILWVRRTGDGVGGYLIQDGLSYQKVKAPYASFFRGRGPVSDVPVQLQLTGVSVSVPPDTYLTTVTYTVVDI